MNQRRAERFDALARLFRYPGEDYATDARALAERLEREYSRAAAAMREFVDYTARTLPHTLEETYTRTFDLNPSCAPEVGWHLFGEEYIRGLFMAHLRNEMRVRGLEETSELPDHVVHVLAVLGAMEEVAAKEMARACVCPAAGKMLQSFDRERSSADSGASPEKSSFLPHGVKPSGTSPAVAEEQRGKRASVTPDQSFRPLVQALAELLLEEFDLPRSTLEAKEADHSAFPADVDPLHSMPCDACGDAQAVGAVDPRLHQIQPNEMSTPAQMDSARSKEDPS